MSHRFGSLRFLPLLAFVLAALFTVSCNLFDRELGENTVGTDGGDFERPLDSLAGGWERESSTDYMQVFVTPQTLKAGFREKAEVVVRVTDRNRNPIAGQTVRFAAEAGTISAKAETDDKGEAKATYTPVAANQDVRLLVGAVIDDAMRFAGTSVSLRGATVKIEASALDTLVNRSIAFTITVKDGDGEAVAGARLTLEGLRDQNGTTDAAGIFRSSATRAEAGSLRVKASAIGASDSLTVGFFTGSIGARTSNLTLYADPGRVAAAEGATSQVKAVLYDDRHNPVVGKTIAFSATHGRITASATTGNDGVATATFYSTALNADARITATASLGDSIKTATTVLTLSGISVDAQAEREDALLRDSVVIAIRLRDGLGKPMGDIPVTVTGAAPTSGRTNSGGLLTVKASSDQERAVSVTASALGTADTVRVFFWRTLPVTGGDVRGAIGNLRIFVNPSNLKASNTDEAQVRVVAFDNLNNPIAGRQVRFTTTAGIVTTADSTDASGEATATLRAVPFNTNARVTATMSVEDSSLTVATTVTFSGLRIEVTPAKRNALVTEDVPVFLRVIDGAGSPVPDVRILFSGNPGVGTTDGAGVLQTSLTSGVQGRVTLRASALGAVDSGFVDFWTVLPGKEQNVDSIRNLRIFSSRSQLRADNTDFATITVILTREGNNPASGETVTFSSNLGIIGNRAVVDSSGRAQVTLRSVPVNGTCRVTALVAGRNLSATTEVLFSGVTLQLLPAKTEYKVGEDAIIEAFLKDGSGNPIGGDDVAFALRGLNGAVFENGQTGYTLSLNPIGRAQVRVRSTAAGTAKVVAQALNTADSVNLSFSNNTLSLATDRGSIGIASTDSIRITATFVNGSNQPVSGATVRFAASAGQLTATSATTNGSGQASVFIKPSAFSGTATIQANTTGGSAQTQVNFLAATAAKIKLEITPDNIAVNGGISTLRAEITDAQGNRVSGQDVSFRILTGPGGGEIIDKPVSQSQAGIALSQLLSGTVPSSYRGVTVEARAGNFADTMKLTISGPPHTITVARPEDDSVTVKNGGQMNSSTFSFNLGAVVQDVNGNPVADGTEVHFSAAVTGMAIRILLDDGWTGVGSDLDERRPKYKSYYLDLPFEDVNNNNRFDPGIDLNLDFDPTRAARGEDRNGDGIFDWNPAQHDYWYDFNNNGICDTGSAEDPNPLVTEGVTIYHDLNNDGQFNSSELIIDRGGVGCGDQPASGDFPYHRWETRNFLTRLPFTDNEFAVVVPTSAVTTAGVANVVVSYPRQLANRLFITVNAEANGKRDKDGERFVIPRIVE